MTKFTNKCGNLFGLPSLLVFIHSGESETNYVFTPSNKEINAEIDLNSKKTATILGVFFLCYIRNSALWNRSFTDIKLC